MATQKIPRANIAAEDPYDAILDLIRGNLRERRGGLFEHNPQSIEAGARALTAGFIVARRRINEIRADRKRRFREYQMTAHRCLGVEDLDAIGSEGELGAAVEMAILTYLLERRGFRPTPIAETPAASLLPTVADVAELTGKLEAAAIRAEADSQIDGAEARDIDALSRKVEDAAVRMRVVAHQRERDGR